jgi:hypothetical protein
MMKRLITLSIILLAFTGSAQDNFGYYGKKTYVDILGTFFMPLIHNFTTGYSDLYEVSPSGNSLRPKDREWFKVAGRVSINRAVKSNVGVGLELGYDRFEVPGYLLLDQQTNYDERHESLQIQSFLIMPKFEISGANGLLPNGIAHQVGIGFLLNKVVPRYYLHDDSNGILTGGPNADQSELDQFMEDNKFDVGYKMMQIMYGLKMRTPVGKSMMISYGIRYTLDMGVTNIGSNYDLGRAIRSYQFRNIISFDLGLTLPF